MSDGDARPFRARNGIPCGLIAIMESDGHVIESACRLRFLGFVQWSQHLME
jgi:hypothetical protein